MCFFYVKILDHKRLKLIYSKSRSSQFLTILLNSILQLYYYYASN